MVIIFDSKTWSYVDTETGDVVGYEWDYERFETNASGEKIPAGAPIRDDKYLLARSTRNYWYEYSHKKAKVFIDIIAGILREKGFSVHSEYAKALVDAYYADISDKRKVAVIAASARKHSDIAGLAHAMAALLIFDDLPSRVVMRIMRGFGFRGNLSTLQRVMAKLAEFYLKHLEDVDKLYFGRVLEEPEQ